MTAFMSSYTDCGNSLLAVNRIGKADNISRRVEMVGQITANPLDSDIIKTIAVENFSCYLIGGQSAAVAYPLVLIVRKFYIQRRKKRNNLNKKPIQHHNIYLTFTII